MKVLIFFFYVALVTLGAYLDHRFSTRIITMVLLISSVYFVYIKKQDFKKKLPVNKSLLLVLLALGFAVFIVLLTYNEEYNKYYDTFYNTSVADIFLTCLLIPIIEEIVFRLYWLKYLNDKMSDTKSIIITSLGFSIIHFYTGVPLLFPFLFGVFSSWLYLKFKNIYLCIIFHILYNAGALLIYTAMQNIEFTSQLRGVGLIAGGIILILCLRQLYISPKIP